MSRIKEGVLWKQLDYVKYTYKNIYKQLYFPLCDDFFQWLYNLYHSNPTKKQLKNIQFEWGMYFEKRIFRISFEEIGKQFENNQKSDYFWIEVTDQNSVKETWHIPTPNKIESLKVEYHYFGFRIHCDPEIFNRCCCFKLPRTILEFIIAGEWLMLDHYLYISLPRKCLFHNQSCIIYCNTLDSKMFCIRESNQWDNWRVEKEVSLAKKIYFDMLDLDSQPIAPLKNLCQKKILDYQTFDILPSINHPSLKQSNKLVPYLKALHNRLSFTHATFRL